MKESTRDHLNSLMDAVRILDAFDDNPKAEDVSRVTDAVDEFDESLDRLAWEVECAISDCQSALYDLKEAVHALCGETEGGQVS